jgi:DNA (cytosine-5)-methyltransferase 1
MIGMTLCSGIGAPEMAAPWVDWRLASEIEAFPRAVLQARFGYQTPEDHNQGEPLLWGDMTEVGPDLLRERGIPLPDIIVAGTPCQSFSVAGLRKGIEDPRGNLTLAFVEICHAIVDARPDGKLTVLLENVTGVLSDKGNAFGAFLGGLVGAMDAIPCPAGGSWPSEGMVEGPRARAAWAVLDAQWFGVAQRRRRVFVVVDFGGAVDPAAVLLEPDRLRGDSPPRRETGQDVAHDVAPSLVSSGRGVERAGETRGQDPVVAVGNQWPADVAPTLNAHFGDKMGLEDQHALSGGGLFVPAGNLDVSQRGGDGPERCRDRDGHAAVAFDLRGREGGAMPEGPHDIAQPWAVRRLTPTECARLQGFPDDHTQIEWRGKPADQCPDGPQYKAYGNSMAVPVIRWIMERIRESRRAAE